jgi:microcystin degradation protein MlrC
MKNLDLEGPVAEAIVAADLRDTMVAYLTYALDDVRTVDSRAYQMLLMTIDALEKAYLSRPH